MMRTESLKRGLGVEGWRRLPGPFLIRVGVVPALVVGLFVAMFLVGGEALRQQQDAMKAVVEMDLESSARLAGINSRLQSANTDIYRLIGQAAAQGGEGALPAQGGDGNLPAQVGNVARRVEGIILDLQDYRSTAAAASQQETLDRFIENLRNYVVAVDWIVSLLEVDVKASSAFITPYNKHVEQLSEQLSAIIAESTATAKARADKASQALRRVVYSYLAAAAVISLLVALFGYLSGKRHELLFAAAQQKSRQVEELLDNSGQGFLSFGADLVIGEACSRTCALMLGGAPQGRAADELLFPEVPAVRKLMRDCVDDALAEADPHRKAMFLSLIPSEIHLGGRILEAEYIPISSGIMVVLSDATEERELAERVRQESRRLEMIVAAVTDGPDFFAAVEDFRAFVREGAAPWRAGDPAELYRLIHTFKGTFNQYGFRYLPPVLHEVEGRLQEALEVEEQLEGAAETPPASETVFAHDWAALLEHDLSLLAEALGADFVAREGIVTLSSAQARRFQSLAQDLLNRSDLEQAAREIATELAGIQTVSLRKELGEFQGVIERIALRLGKEVAPLAIEGEDLRIDPESCRPFLRSLGHLFRNAVDHGIEDPDSRLAAGKDEAGRIACQIACRDGRLILEIEDDGQGIDEAALRSRAARLLRPEEVNCSLEDLLFLDGLSSREEASDLSGRGIGLAAVRAEVRRLGGDIDIQTWPGQGCRFILRLPLAAVSAAA